MAYFALMETLQAVQYSFINLCDNPINKALTLVGFFHLAFQPFFVNYYVSEFMTKGNKRYVPLMLTLSLFAGVLMSNRMWKSPGDIPCSIGIEPLCGVSTCTFRGSVHLAWQMPMQHADQDYFTPGFQLHFFMFYMPMFALGMWKFTLFLLVSGPFLGRALTNHQDEIPAIWCFFSIAQLFFPLFEAALSKTQMFAPKTVPQEEVSSPSGVKTVLVKPPSPTSAANGNGNGSSSSTPTATALVAADKPDNDDGDITFGQMVFRSLILLLGLTAKRYATIFLAGGAADLAVSGGGLQAPMPVATH